MIYEQPAEAFTARVDGLPTGLTGTVGVRILDASGGTTTARTTAGIIESPTGSGSYLAALVAPDAGGDYSIFWDDGTISPSTTASEGLTVNDTGTQPAPPDGYTPTVAEVASILPLRTFDDNTNEVGTFTGATRPTDTQVQSIVNAVSLELEGFLGADVPDILMQSARNIVKYRAAMMIEVGFFADQIRADLSPYPELLQLYKEARADFLTERGNIAPDGGADQAGAGFPQFSFPSLDGRGVRAPGGEHTWPWLDGGGCL